MLFAAEFPQVDVANLVTGGSFGALTWYLLTRMLPKMVADFRADLEAERHLRATANEKLAAEIKQHTHDRMDSLEEKLSLRFDSLHAELWKRKEDGKT